MGVSFFVWVYMAVVRSVVGTSAIASEMTCYQERFCLGLTVIGLGLGVGVVKYWSRSHTCWSRGPKSIICTAFLECSGL